MWFERTIYPVGHGSFFGERFLDDDGNIIFQVVYDCGSTTLYQSPSPLDCSIDKFASVNGDIDYLFISQFDDSHINGIIELDDKCKIRNIVLPVIPDDVMAASKIEFPFSDLVNLLNWINISHIKVYVVGDNKPTTSIPNNCTFHQSGKPLLTNIKSGNNKWIYIPISGTCEYGKEQKSKNRNQPFLVLYSGLDHLNTGLEVSIRRDYGCVFSREELDDPHIVSDKEACLYMGDIFYRKYTRTYLMDAIGNRRSQIGLIQLPNHGAKANLNVDCLGSKKSLDLKDVVCFTTYERSCQQNVPSQENINKLRAKGAYFRGITNDSQTLYQETFALPNKSAIKLTIT